MADRCMLYTAVKYVTLRTCRGRHVKLIFSERELMFMFALWRRRSVCRLSVCNVRAPYSAD